jgi:hypothetical protein
MIKRGTQGNLPSRQAQELGGTQEEIFSRTEGITDKKRGGG